MTSGLWRTLLLALSVLVGLVAVLDGIRGQAGPHGTSLVGVWGDTVGASAQPYHLLVLSIDPTGSAGIVGLRAGDRIDVRANTPLERFWLFGQPPTGRSVTVLARRGDEARHLTIVPQSTALFRRLLLAPIWFGFIWIALFAAIIAWSKSGEPQMRMLCLLLLAYGLWETTNQHYIGTGALWIHVVAAVANVLGTTAVAFWAACAGTFAPPRSALRRATQLICYGLIAVSIAIGLIRIAGIVALIVDPVALSSPAASLPFALACVAGGLCSLLAVGASRGAERQRAIWSLLPGGVLVIVGFGAESTQGVVSSYELAWASFYIAAAANVFVPMVLTYVALNRRLLDIGFVLNRTAVFAIVSGALVAALVIVEWIANEWLSANHTTSAVIGMLVALALGVSIRYVHTLADRFIDRVVFRKRHEAEAALRRFAHEAAFVTDRKTLLERTVSAVRASTGASASVLTLDDGCSVDENDPALVALRAWHKPVDLETLPESALQGQFAFPMVARGQLVGALICGTKADSEVYAPDESEALQSVADGVGNALGVFANVRTGLDAALTEAISELQAAIRELRHVS